MRGGKPVPYKHLVDESIRLAAISAGQGDHRQSRPRPRHERRRRARPRLRGAARAAHGRAGAVRMARIERAVVHPLHVRHHRQAEGRAARHRRLRGRAGVVDAPHLLRRARRDDVHHQRHRLGRRPLVHRLRPAAQRPTTIMYEGLPIRPDPGIWWKIVADHKVKTMFSSPTAIRVLKKQDTGVHEGARRVDAALPVPRRRAARRADRALGVRRAGRRDRRQLLADRDRLADPLGAARRRGHAAQVRQPVVPGVRLRRAAAARRHRRARSAPTKRAC